MSRPGCGVVVAALLSTLTFTGCGSHQPSAVPRLDVEAQAKAELAKSVGAPIDNVTCPGDLTASVGQTMHCEFRKAEVVYGITLTVTQADNDMIKFGIKLDNQTPSGTPAG